MMAAAMHMGPERASARPFLPHVCRLPAAVVMHEVIVPRCSLQN